MTKWHVQFKISQVISKQYHLQKHQETPEIFLKKAWNERTKIYFFLIHNNFKEKMSSPHFQLLIYRLMAWGRYLLPLKLTCVHLTEYSIGTCTVKILFFFFLTKSIRLYSVCLLQNSIRRMEYSNMCLYVIKNSKFLI